MSIDNLLKYTTMATELDTMKQTLNDMHYDNKGLSRHSYSVGNLYALTRQKERSRANATTGLRTSASNNSCIDLRKNGQRLAVYSNMSSTNHSTKKVDNKFRVGDSSTREDVYSDYDIADVAYDGGRPSILLGSCADDSNTDGDLNAEVDSRYRYPLSDTFEKKESVSDDLKMLSDMPELCDVTFLVGPSKTPVYGVKALLATRNRSFYKMLTQAQPLSKKKSGSGLKLFGKRQPCSEDSRLSIHVDEFDANVFRKVVQFLQTGCVQFTPESALGLLNAAEHYGQEDLKIATNSYLEQCINLDTVCNLLTSAQKYFHYKTTKVILQKILQFVDKYGESVLMIDQFASLPKDIISLVLSREELHARETTKLFVAVKWCRRYCHKNPDVRISTAMSYFVDSIDFKQIPANVLMNDIKPLNIIKESIMIEALAFQLESSAVEEDKKSKRQMCKTLSCRIPVANTNNIYSNVQSMSYRATSHRMSFFKGDSHQTMDDNSQGTREVAPPLPPKSWRLTPRRRSSFTESTDSVESDSGMSSIDESMFNMRHTNISYF